MLAVLAVLAALIGPDQPRKVDQWAVVNGSRYRVTVQGDTFLVNKKAAAVKDTMAERDAQREAVRLATGCKPIDELHKDARLRGRLDCSK